ncbi:MAG: hypothetical protein ACI971_001144 [Colwellia sp.]|jgi:hypothetical protein
MSEAYPFAVMLNLFQYLLFFVNDEILKQVQDDGGDQDDGGGIRMTEVLSG